MSRSVRRSGALAWVDEGERVVVLRLEELAEPPLVLAGSAAHLWRSLGEEEVAVDLVVDELAAGFGAAAEVVRRDVDDWLEDAVATGLVVLTPAAT